MADAIKSALSKLKKPGDRSIAKFDSPAHRHNAFYQRIYREADRRGFTVAIRTIGSDVHLLRKDA